MERVYDHDGERSRYHGPNPTRRLAPLVGLLLAAGFAVKATGHEPLTVAADTLRFFHDRVTPVSYLPEAAP